VQESGVQKTNYNLLVCSDGILQQNVSGCIQVDKLTKRWGLVRASGMKTTNKIRNQLSERRPIGLDTSFELTYIDTLARAVARMLVPKLISEVSNASCFAYFARAALSLYYVLK